jgi:hypothetical protein
MRTSSPQPVCLPYFFGHFFLPIIIVFVGLSIVISDFFASVHAYDSGPLLAPFDDAKDPFFTLLIADLHHTQVNPGRPVSNVIKLSNFTRKLNPAILSIAGDLVDALNVTASLAGVGSTSRIGSAITGRVISPISTVKGELCLRVPATTICILLAVTTTFGIDIGTIR